jgi:hypothetical protein
MPPRKRRIQPVELAQPTRTVQLGAFVDRGCYLGAPEHIRVEGPGVVTERNLHDAVFKPAKRLRPGVYVVTKRLFKVEHGRA